MIATACDAHPRAEFWFARSGSPGRGKWLADSCSTLTPISHRIGPCESLCASLPYFDQIYTVSAPEGMQALLSGMRPNVFGTPYYSGWGLTTDYVEQPRQGRRASLAALFEAVFVKLSHHIDPVTHVPGTLDALLTSIETHRATVLRFADISKVAGVHFQWWKRPLVTPYLTAGGGSLRWVKRPSHVRENEHAALWGSRSTRTLASGIPVLRVEDGFLHSSGLGSDHIAPCSQVIDRRGIYFDPTQPSDLTIILNEANFSETEIARAQALRSEIARLGLTKYNLGRRKPTWHAPAGKQVILVPGQVADDASIRLGTRGITTAEQLLREVRIRRPNAFVVYKPHPDVLSGNRSGLIEAAELADRVELDADMVSLIEVADEIHTLSSLSGFEALIRDKPVFCYGLPFYAGWGLTYDALVQPWRKRKLSINMLVAGVLLRYPVYWDWSLRLFTTPEAIAYQIARTADRPLEKIRDNRLRFFLKAWRWSRNGMQHLASRVNPRWK
ncbi:capsular biosynthesis protein [Burkholderia pseudomultivorans]|uniref:capsular polysaccharide export protein, LipB/KpsS family n=1 Tax=Burkholderia pseudomultivorans TaxID=1207504 RepID=UPI002EDB3B9D